MKKLAIGCLIAAGVLVVLALVAATAGYFLVYRPTLSALTYVSGAERLETRLTNRSPYEPPASGDLTEEQVARFLQVEERVQTGVGGRMAVFAEQHSQLERAAEGKRGPTRRQVHAALGTIGPVYLKAKSAQIDALNAANFSRAKYEWVRAQVYPAAGLPLARLDLRALMATEDVDFEEIIGLMRSPADQAVSEHNRALVERHLPRLKDWLALAFFDL